MRDSSKCLLAVLAAIAAPNLAAMAVTVTASSGGTPTPQTLAESIADGTSVTVVAKSPLKKEDIRKYLTAVFGLRYVSGC